MSDWSVMVLLEVTYRLQADSEDEAREKAERGDFDEVEYGDVNQIMSVEEMGNAVTKPN